MRLYLYNSFRIGIAPNRNQYWNCWYDLNQFTIMRLPLENFVPFHRSVTRL